MTEHDFNNFIEETSRKLKSIKEKSEILNLFCNSVQEFIPSKNIKLLSIDAENKIAITMELVESDATTYPLDQGGIISQCYEFKQPLIVNDISRSLLCNKDIDLLGMEDIHKILTLPIIENREPNSVVGIVWIGIDKGLQQFIQLDLENLARFSNTIKNKLFSDGTNIEDTSLAACREYRRGLQTKLERLENSFASTIHDIRTPMNAVIGFMELMMLSEKDNQKRDYIDATLKSGEHIVALINDALDMSKVSSGQMSLNRTNFSPINGISDIAKLFYNSMKKKSIDFRIYIDPLMPTTIHSDLHRIKQILNNLLSNALKFTPSDGTVTVDAKYESTNHLLHISVRDTGIGIAKESQKNIFSPYRQESSETASEYGGTGLGLAISQQLSILLGGKLTLESEKGKGCKFEFILPCDAVEDGVSPFELETLRESSIVIQTSKEDTAIDLVARYFDDLHIEYTKASEDQILSIPTDASLYIICRDSAIDKVDEIQEFLDSGGAVLLVENSFDSKHCRFEGNIGILSKPILPNMLFDSINRLIDPSKVNKSSEDIFADNEKLKGYSVLIVDDSVINLKLMTEILKKFHLDVSSNTSPIKALEVLQNRIFDIIFIDQNMPQMDGDMVIKKIREDEKSKNLKPVTIYALTGTADEAVREKMLDAGADDVYEKPIHIKEIHAAIVKAIH